MTFSAAVMFWKSRMFWNVRAMPSRVIWCGGLPDITVPEKMTRPRVGL